ncbi:acyl transferase/acyl hydrolase/lysophospholipase [Yarrowia lipolytica]|nr:acyl transferase/acyl hydrolase/lysophospholipase [Yarrowia lipolytica]
MQFTPLFLHLVATLAASPGGTYEPKHVDCPPTVLVREANDTLNPKEKDYMDRRWLQTQQEHVKFMERLDIPDFNVSFLDEVPPVVMGTAFSGGGYRSMLTGAGVVAAMDARVNGSLDLGALGGLFQAMSYLVGLSSGSWLLTSLFLNDNFTVPDLQAAPNLWSLENSFWGGERMKDVQLDNPVPNPGIIDNNGTESDNSSLVIGSGLTDRLSSRLKNLVNLAPRNIVSDSIKHHWNRRPSTGGAEVVKNINLNDMLAKRPNSGIAERLRNMPPIGESISNGRRTRPSTGFADRLRNRPKTGISDRLHHRPSTGLSDRLRNRPSTGVSDTWKNRPKTGYADRLKNSQRPHFDLAQRLRNRPKTGIYDNVDKGISRIKPGLSDARKALDKHIPSKPSMGDFFNQRRRQSDLEKLLEYVSPDFLCDLDYSEFLKYLDPLYTYYHLENEIKQTLYYFLMIKEEVDLKSSAGFVTTITDYWGRALARQLLPDSRGGQGTTWSDVQITPQFMNASVPFPIMVAIGREPSESNSTYMISPLWSTLFEMTPFEFGSWNPSLNAFSDTRYLGSSLYNGTPVNNVTLEPVPSTEPVCVLGYDNAGFLAGTSSSVFNDPFENSGIDQDYIRELFTGIIDALENFNTSFWGEFFSTENSTVPETDLTWRDADYAIFSPNPFLGFDSNATTDKFSESKHLFLADGGEDGQLVPFEPLLQEQRNVDVIFAIDASSNTEDNFPDGTALRMSQERYLSEDSEQAAGISFPQLAAEFGNEPVFLGCFINSSYSVPPKGRAYSYNYRRDRPAEPNMTIPVYPPPPPFDFPNSTFDPNSTFSNVSMASRAHWRARQIPVSNGTTNDTGPIIRPRPRPRPRPSRPRPIIEDGRDYDADYPYDHTTPIGAIPVMPPTNVSTDPFVNVTVGVDKYPPLIVYIPNSYQSYWTGDSTFQVEFSTEDVAGYITNGYNLMTRQNSTVDPDWNKCVGCATILRAYQGANKTIPDFCMGCFDRYCVDSINRGNEAHTRDFKQRVL